jgi:hypothetical protein
MRFGHIFLGDVLDAADLLDLVLELLDRAVEQLLIVDLGQVPIDLAGAAGPAATVSETFSGLVSVGSLRTSAG